VLKVTLERIKLVGVTLGGRVSTIFTGIFLQEYPRNNSTVIIVPMLPAQGFSKAIGFPKAYSIW
jgi:hypothetical protein